MGMSPFEAALPLDDVSGAAGDDIKVSNGWIMGKARDLINAHLFPVLGVIATATLVGIFLQLDTALSNGANRSQQARNHNLCVKQIMELPIEQKPNVLDRGDLAGAVRYCNGG